MAARATHAQYNAQRAAGDVLTAYSHELPSITIHLNDGSFRFGRQPGIFTFDSPAAAFLDCIRAQRVPVGLLDVFSEANVPFRDGCLVVEIHDHRRAPLPPVSSPARLDAYSTTSKIEAGPGKGTSSGTGSSADATSGSASGAGSVLRSDEDPLSANLLHQLARSSRTFFTNQHRWPFYGNTSQRSTERLTRGASSADPHDDNLAEIYRIVLFPTAETIWQELKNLDADLGGQWTDEDALVVEAGILVCILPANAYDACAHSY